MNNFTWDQIYDIAIWLEKWNLPIKYAYMTPIGDTAWTEIEKNRNNSGSAFLDSAIFTDSIETYLNDMGNPNSLILIDIGGWAGFTSKPVIQSLQNKSIEVEYHTIDISEEMIQKNQSYLSSIVDSKWHLLDIDEWGLRTKIRAIKIQNPNTPILLTIFGSTIGNFPEARALLRQIEWVLSTTDRIVIWSQIHQPGHESQILKIYQDDESTYKIISSTINSLKLTLEWSYNFSWNTQEKMIEGWLIVNQDSQIQIWWKCISFIKNDYIRLLESRKHTLGSIIELAGNMRVSITKSDIRWKFMQIMFAPCWI